MSNRKTIGPVYPREIIGPREGAFTDAQYRGYLPHLVKEGCSYFVTFCLADVRDKRKNARERLEVTDNPDSIASVFEPEVAAGDCILRDPKIAIIVEQALLHFQSDRYDLSAWCVMPNHVHAVVTPYIDRPLGKILHSWKSFTAHEINRIRSRKGRVWQEESFDHLVRNPDAFHRFVTYTEQNPVSAGLVDEQEEWPFSSARFRKPDVDEG